MSEKVALGHGALRLSCDGCLAISGDAGGQSTGAPKRAGKGMQPVLVRSLGRGRFKASSKLIPPSEIAVLWSLVAAGVTGILLGCRARAPALIAATAVVVVVGAGLFDRHRLLSILLLVVTLQCAYLIGLFVGLTWRRGVTRKR